MSKDEWALVDFANLVAYVPVGVCKFVLDDEFTLLYANQCLYEMWGYTAEQFAEECGNKVLCSILEEERGAISKTIAQVRRTEQNGFRMEHRIVRRDGTLMWALVSGTVISDGEIPSAYGVVVDITDRKQMEERLRIDEERFRLAFTQTDSTIFDYDIATKVMLHADKAAGLYGLSYQTENVPEALVEKKVIHPDSTEVFLEMYRLIRAGAPTASCVMQARKTDGDYAWRKIVMTNIFDSDGVAVRAVGMLEDIDEQMRREKHLLERSQRDPLTGLYNKGTTESHIRKLLERQDENGVLFIIDVDSFKAVNDGCGHLFGDLVLAESACRISALCRHGDVIGRIGGDEFLLYLEGALTNTAAIHKAQKICAAFVSPFSHNGTSAHITCTVGLARCPEDGNAFEILYQKADVALYEAKRQGKNRCCAYEESMNANAHWVPYSNTQIDEPVSLQS